MGRVRARPAADGGFSIVELTVIVIIIGVLASIATVTYLKQRQRGEQASAVSTLTNVRLTAESLAADDGNEYVSDPDRYEQEQSAYDFLAGTRPSTGNRIVSVHGDEDGDWVAFAVLGRDHCYFMRLERGSGDIIKSTSTGAACRADAFGLSVPGTGTWG